MEGELPDQADPVGSWASREEDVQASAALLHPKPEGLDGVWMQQRPVVGGSDRRELGGRALPPERCRGEGFDG